MLYYITEEQLLRIFEAVKEVTGTTDSFTIKDIPALLRALGG